MQIRHWLVLAFLFAILVGNVILISNEQIHPINLGDPEENEVDPIDVIYTVASREQDLKTLGLSEEEALAGVKQATRMEERWGDNLREKLRSADDQEGLKAALCGDSTAELPPRYGAMRFLVRADGNQRRPLNLDRFSGQLEQQEWSRAANLVGVYQAVERNGDGRQDNATLMGVAAILSVNERKAIEVDRPWGSPSSVLGDWSWTEVKARYSSIEQDVLDYLVLMHVVVTYAQAEGGVCGQ